MQNAAERFFRGGQAVVSLVSMIASFKAQEHTSVGPLLYACVRSPRRVVLRAILDCDERVTSVRSIFTAAKHQGKQEVTQTWCDVWGMGTVKLVCCACGG
jgi:hypothetical protein